MPDKPQQLCIIAGAGASHAADKKIALTKDLVPPLRERVTDDTSAQLILNRVDEIRNRSGDDFNFESALANARDKATLLDEERARGYLALRFALWDYFIQVGQGTKASLWDNVFMRIRNYSSIATDIWCLTTNYDLLLEKALARQWKGSGYADKWTVRHPHGSIEYALECTDQNIRVRKFPYPVDHPPVPMGVAYTNAYNRYRREVISVAAAAHAHEEDWEILPQSPLPTGPNPLYALGFTDPSKQVGPQVRIPALEMPVYENKSPRLWTPHLQAETKSRLESADYVIVVGWAATDEHISNVVKEALSVNQSAEVQIMCSKGSEDVAERLGVDKQRAVIPNSGNFSSSYLDTETFTNMVGPIG